MMTTTKQSELEQFEKEALLGACLPAKELAKANSVAIKATPKMEIKEETKSKSPLPKISQRLQSKYLNTKDSAYKEQMRKFKSRTFLLP